jgi:hypothetical protein
VPYLILPYILDVYNTNRLRGQDGVAQGAACVASHLLMRRLIMALKTLTTPGTTRIRQAWQDYLRNFLRSEECLKTAQMVESVAAAA